MRVYWVAIALFATLFTSNLVNADIYECRDRSGNIHFSNMRKSGMRCKTTVKSSKKAASKSTKTAPKHQRSREQALLLRASNRSGPLEPLALEALIQEAAQVYQIPVAFIRAVMKVESNFNPRVVSKTGAMGLMQLMPKTAAAMGVSDPFDPRQNVLGGARYLRLLANRFNGDLVLTIAAYNAGEGAVDKYSGIPPYTETQRYVRRVLTHYYRFRGAKVH